MQYAMRFYTIIVENRFLLYYKHFLLSDDVSQTKHWISAQSSCSSAPQFSISGNAAARCLVQFVDKGRDIIVTVNIQNPLVAKNKSCKILTLSLSGNLLALINEKVI